MLKTVITEVTTALSDTGNGQSSLMSDIIISTELTFLCKTITPKYGSAKYTALKICYWIKLQRAFCNANVGEVQGSLCSSSAPGGHADLSPVSKRNLQFPDNRAPSWDRMRQPQLQQEANVSKSTSHVAEVNYLRQCGPSSRGMCLSSWGIFLFAYSGLLKEKRWFHDLTYIVWKDSRCPLTLFCTRSNPQAQRPLCTGNRVCGWLQQFLHLGPDGSIHNCKGVRRRRRRAKCTNTWISIPEYLACHISHHRREKQYNYELIGCKNAVSCQL